VYSRPQKLLVEFLGTLALVLFSAGALCADQFLRSINQAGIGPLGTALAYGLTFGALVAAVGNISGGHFNPAVTIAFWVTRRLNLFDTLSYWIAQLAGALAAAYLLRFILPEETWRAVALGTPDLAGGLTRAPAMLIEGLMTFFLVLAFFAVTVPVRSSGATAGLSIAFTVTVATLFGAPFTGAAMNPARAFGPALASHHWTNHGVYWIGPLAGAMLAGVLFDALLLRQATSNQVPD
jgi:MIP family channel proteins